MAAAQAFIEEEIWHAPREEMRVRDVEAKLRLIDRIERSSESFYFLVASVALISATLMGIGQFVGIGFDYDEMVHRQQDDERMHQRICRPVIIAMCYLVVDGGLSAFTRGIVYLTIGMMGSFANNFTEGTFMSTYLEVISVPLMVSGILDIILMSAICLAVCLLHWYHRIGYRTRKHLSQFLKTVLCPANVL